MSEQPLLVVLGATATGKTRFALALARAVGGEIVNFDASLVHRGFDIATAKPTAAEREQVRHHLVDCCEPDEEFSAARFVALAEEALADIRSRRRRAILVGGTGLYLRCLLRGLVDSPPPDEALRRRLEERETRRPGSLLRLLGRLDPATAARLSAADAFRAVRALEHRLATGRPISADQREWEGPERHAAIKLGLELPRAEREQRIVARIDAMFANGLVEEVRSLRARGVPATARAFRALGYREVLMHLEGRLGLDEVRHRMRLATRQYAKRQDTWFRKEGGVNWLPSPGSDDELSALVRRAMMAAGLSE